MIDDDNDNNDNDDDSNVDDIQRLMKIDQTRRGEERRVYYYQRELVTDIKQFIIYIH